MMLRHIEHLAISVLDNFFCEVPEIQVTSYLKIMRIDFIKNPRAEDLWGHFNQRFTLERVLTRFLRDESGNFIPNDVPEVPFYALVWDYSNDVSEPIKAHYDFLVTPKRWMNDTVTALRILGKGIVRRYPEQNTVEGIPGLENSPFARFIFNSNEGYIPVSSDELGVLSPNDVATLPNLVEIVNKIKSATLRVATSRLDRQHTREDIFDGILDTAIGLEALYVPGIKAEISFRMGMRVAIFLGGNSPTDRQEIFDLIQTIYDARSDIAHGNRSNIVELEKSVLKNTKWKTAEELLSAMTDLLRLSLKRILLEVGERTFTDNPGFHRALDMAIVTGLPLQIS